MKLFSFVLAFSQAEEGGALEIFDLQPETGRSTHRGRRPQRGEARPRRRGEGVVPAGSRRHDHLQLGPLSPSRDAGGRREGSLDRLQLHGRKQDRGPRLLLGLTRARDVPAYFDFLIDGFWSGRVGRNVHLGYWDEPPSLAAPCGRQEFEAAQARLTDILDRACRPARRPQRARRRLRFRRHARSRRQAARTCGSSASTSTAASWTSAARCRWAAIRCRSSWRMPAHSRSGRAVSIGCFASRRCFISVAEQTFLREAADALCPGGRLVLSDILLRNPGEHAPLRHCRDRSRDQARIWAVATALDRYRRDLGYGAAGRTAARPHHRCHAPDLADLSRDRATGAGWFAAAPVGRQRAALAARIGSPVVSLLVVHEGLTRGCCAHSGLPEIASVFICH